MGQPKPRRLNTRPQSAASRSHPSAKISCPVNGQVKRTPEAAGPRWIALVCAVLLAIVQGMAVELGHTLSAGPALWGMDTLVAPHRPGPASPPAIRAKARAHHIRLLAEARQAEQQGHHTIAREAFATLFIHATDPSLRLVARDALVDQASRAWPKGFRSRFLTSLSPSVLSAAREHQVPPSVTLAQAILESGWGRSRLTRDYHNLFGVKAGRSSQRIRLASREHMRGRLRPSHQTFRRYDSKDHSIQDHAELLGTDRRYAHAREHWTDWRRFIEAIAPRYASSPTYVNAVSKIIELYDLDQWDALIVAAVEADQRVPPTFTTADARPEPADDPPDTGQPPLDG